MFSVSAFNRAVVLLSAILLLAVLWGFFRIPDANLLIVVWGALSSALLAGERSFSRRSRKALLLACYAAAWQFLISVSADWPFAQIILMTAMTCFSFLTLPDHHAGCIVMIVSSLAFFAPPGFSAAAGRCADIFAALPVVLAITAFDHTKEEKMSIPAEHYSHKQALLLAAEIGIGTFIFKVLRLTQGPWIILTVFFIRMSETPELPGRKLAWQRIFAAPAGIIAGGFLLGTFFRIDARLVYLLPFIGAASFFVFYNYGNFFLFSIIFMITLTLFADWMSGTYGRFYFWDNFLSRTVSTLLGAFLELFLRRHPELEKEKAV